MAEFRLETERLILRDWREEDLNPFAVMSADPTVMATLGPIMTREEAAALIARVIKRKATYGYTMWAVERREDSRFLGWCGLIRGEVGPITDKLEIGWRLASDAWGQGYAREGAEAAMDWGFANLPDDRIWAITSAGNGRSWGLMERLGMTRRPDLDFEHPKLSEGDPLLRHVTYSIERETWCAGR